MAHFHLARCYLNSHKLFLTLSDQYCNPERGFELLESQATTAVFQKRLVLAFFFGGGGGRVLLSKKVYFLGSFLWAFLRAFIVAFLGHFGGIFIINGHFFGGVCAFYENDL